jgi:pSer/pThr/pTyr-binding forkhead associated (FHA) protein
MVGPPRLTSMSPEGQKESYDLRFSVVKIGRAGDNHLAFPQEKTISGHHCEIFREGKDFFVRDLGSTNGVFVNGRKVDSAPLQEGDEIKLGGKIFFFTRAG